MTNLPICYYSGTIHPGMMLLFYGVVYRAEFILQLRTRLTGFSFSALSLSGLTSELPLLVRDT